MDIIQIIDQCAKGDNSAWEIFLKDYGPIARNILRKFTDLEDGDVENVMQNVFMKLIKGGFQNFRGRTRYEFLKYYKITVVNEAQTYLKAENRWKHKVEDFISFPSEFEEQMGDEQLQFNHEDVSLKPDVIAEQREIIKILEDALREFPLKEQEIFILKVKGHKDKEISQLMGIPMGTVASRFARIVEKIKDGLKKRGV